MFGKMKLTFYWPVFRNLRVKIMNRSITVDEQSSPARTLGSWVVILVEAWMYYVSICFVLCRLM
jgi:hypothetical protein